MALPDLVVTSRRAVLPDGVREAAIVVHSGRIAAISPADRAPEAARRVDLGDAALVPGLVESHAHLNEPGREAWEGFESGTRAAIAGGITTVVDMPLNSIPATTSRQALETKVRAAEGRCSTDYAFWGGVVPGNAGELEGMIDAGVCGFKCFLIDSGVPEFGHVGELELRRAMPVLARRGAPLLVHAELESAVKPGRDAIASRHAGEEGSPAGSGDPRRYASYVASRPRAWENEAVRMMIRLARETGCRTHIVHLSSSDVVGDIREARRQGVPISAETCPHYLTFCAEEVPDGATLFKCAPPIRERENRERLWDGLRDGTISMIVSDHSPCEPELKKLEAGSFFEAWGGIAGLQFSLPAAWTGMRERGLGLERLAGWMAEAPAVLAGLTNKGRLAIGGDADLVAFEPEAPVEISPSGVHHRHKLTPYSGRRLSGAVRRVWLRGEPAYEDGRFRAPGGARQGRTRTARVTA
ncbi:MAG: allantoinase AllB [Elusimicrobia bacterium]|nr:allantoinase AllB [Elusimicrobiota bacterium]